MKYNALIIDDEKLARERLIRLLKAYEDRIHIVGEASDGKEALELAERLKPDLLFLDIQMPIMDGFALLEALSFDVHVLFTTAYDQYALKAFEENSVDYLLKPVEQERLDKSIEKLAFLEKRSHKDDLEKLISQIQSPTSKHIPVQTGGKIILLKVSDIVYLQAEDKYIQAYDKNKNCHLLSGTLKEFEQKLGDNFLRIHRSILLNSDYILEIRKSFNGRFNFTLQNYESKTLQSSQSQSSLIKKLLDF